MRGESNQSGVKHTDVATRPPGRRVPAWWLVMIRELSELWIGGRALGLIVFYAVLLGAFSFATAMNSEIDLIPPKEMVFFALQMAIGVGLFIGLINGADSISGERERATFEALLLTPTSRRQIVAGKLLAGFSSWPVAMLVAIPFLKVLSQGDEIFGESLFWGGILGSLLALGYTGLGMLVSFWSNSNMVSFFVSLTIYIVCVAPTQWPGPMQKGLVGKFVQRVNPIEAANEFLEKILVNHRAFAQFQSWLRSPVLFAVIILALLFPYASPRLRLHAGQR